MKGEMKMSFAENEIERICKNERCIKERKTRHGSH
jgi:hypothetical protein